MLGIDFDRYVVEDAIGAGGFGVVYAARDASGCEVAIKVLRRRYARNEEAVARFLLEARILQRINDPSVVAVHHIARPDEARPYFVMERLHGRTLGDVLRVDRRLLLEIAMPLLRGIASAVDAIHRNGVVHRDIKPDNVFISRDGSVKLIDFGLACIASDTAPTDAEPISGTPLYMSPEQCRGDSTGLETDLYGFGALAYHVLIGEPPFRGDPLALALQHLNATPVAPSRRHRSLDAGVDAILLSLLAKDPSLRPRPLVPLLDSLAQQLRGT